MSAPSSCSARTHDAVHEAVGPYMVSYCANEEGRVRRSLEEVAHIPFHDVEPIRSFASHRRQSHLPGLFWFATTGRHIGYESRLELSVLVMLDYDLEVEAVASQPFCLHAATRTGSQIGHVPDYFALLAGGRGRVVDVTPVDKRDLPERRLRFELAARACTFAGWEYRIESEPDPTLLTNVRALAGFRREPVALDRFGAALISACATPTTIRTLTTEIGLSALVRPVLFHLLWKQLLIADISEPLSDETLIKTDEETSSRR